MILTLLSDVLIHCSNRPFVNKINFHNKIPKSLLEGRRKLQHRKSFVKFLAINNINFTLPRLLAKGSSETLQQGCFPAMPVNIQTAKYNVEAHIMKLWHRKWKSQTLAHSKYFLEGPDPDLGKLLCSFDRSRMRLFTQSITGHSNIVGKQRVYYGIEDSNECQLCLEDDESILHWLQDCPALQY